MKKILSVLFCFFLFTTCFSQKKTETIIYSEEFASSQIQEINAILQNEKITVQKYLGENILLEIDSNNLNYKPIVSCINNTISITSANYKPSKVDYCILILYIPVNNKISSINLQSNTDIKIQNVTVQDDIFVYSLSDSQIFLEKTKCDNLCIFCSKGNIVCKKTVCNFFYVEGIFSNVDFDLINKNLDCSSQIKTKNGKINFEFPDKNNFVFVVYSHNNTINAKNQEIFENPQDEQLSTTTKVKVILEAESVTIKSNVR